METGSVAEIIFHPFIGMMALQNILIACRPVDLLF
jgi:hypothetical protein